MLASACYRPQAGGYRAHAGGRCRAGLAALKRCDLVLKHRGGGVSEAAVNVSALFTGKAAAALLAVFKVEG